MHCMCQAHHAMTIHGLNPRGRKSNACADLYHQNNSCWKHRWGWGKRSWCVMMCLEAPSRSLQRHGYARNRSKKCAVFCPNCYDCITRLSDFDMTFSHLQQHAKVVAPSRSRQINVYFQTVFFCFSDSLKPFWCLEPSWLHESCAPTSQVTLKLYPQIWKTTF